ncbi:hypothetical protein JKF63_07657 [Porcisia hertigi]|uniref:Uncharacterized protein n=1 Tax=Porcisia hertigi TaxID=2761500 RepID=A0A836IDS8_9TRYP|nr:hypothetical protein JKF63_07657 [Porcisia hertigi]
MRSISPSPGVGPDSVSQHVRSKRSLSQSRQQGPSLSAGGGRPRPASAALSAQRTSRDVSFLSQQIHEALQQHSRLEEERQKQLVQYRRHLRTLCDENATLRNIIHAGESRRRDVLAAEASGLVTTNGGCAHPSSMGRGPATVTEAEMEILSQRIHLARQRHNRALHDICATEAALSAEVKAQESLMEQSEATLDPMKSLMGANRSVYLRIMRLEQLMNNLLTKQRTAGVLLSNYRHHLSTLQREATQYDVQQKLLDKEYANRHRDHLQLIQLYDKARAAYATATGDLQALRTSASRMQKLKEKALRHKRREVERELVAAQHQERRVVDLQQQLEEETQSLEAAENRKAQLEWQRINSNAPLTRRRSFMASPEGSAGPSEEEDNNGMSTTGADERAAAYEVAFRDMMRFAKVSTLDDLVKAYQAEIDQQNRLQHELDHVRETQAALQQEVQQLREWEKQTKYCVGAGTRLLAEGPAPVVAGTTSSHLMERELQTFVRETTTSLVAHVGANEASQSILRGVAERVNRLAELVAHYRSDVQVAPIQFTPDLTKRSSTLPLHIAVLAQKLLALAVDTAGAADLRPFPTTAPVTASNDPVAAVISSTQQLVIPANNRRVSSTHDSAGGRRGRAAADVAGISSTTARALLYSHGAAHGGRESHAPSSTQGRRKSFSAAGAGFIEGQEREEDVSLVTVVGKPSPGGRVLDFDDASTDTSEAYSSPADGGDAGGNGGEVTGDSETHSKTAASTRGGGRLSLPRSRLAKAAGSGALQAHAQARAKEMEDDQEDPLRREEVKRMSAQIRDRQKLKAAKNARHV